MSTDFIPKADNKFLVWLKVLIAYLTEKQRRWNISKDEVSNLQALEDDFEGADRGKNALLCPALGKQQRRKGPMERNFQRNNSLETN